MSHGDTIASLPPDCEVIASTEDVEVGAYASTREPTFGLQFHPEVYHTTEGKTILHNFLDKICGCSMDWTPETFVESTIHELKAKLGNDQVSSWVYPEESIPQWLPYCCTGPSERT
jgi:GMP synthase (glutamine-hydrolysing)